MSSTSAPLKVMADVLDLLRDLMRAGGLSPRAATPVAPPAAPPRSSANGVALPSRPAVAMPSSAALARLPVGDPLLGAGASVQGFFAKAGWSGASAAMAPLPGTSQDRVGLAGAAGVATAPAEVLGAPVLEAASVAAFFRPVDWSGRTVPVMVDATMSGGAGATFAAVTDDDLFAYPVHQFFSRVGWKGGATVVATNGHAPAAAEPAAVAQAVPSKRRETGTAQEMFGEFKF